jgi:hypothetical protein
MDAAEQVDAIKSDQLTENPRVGGSNPPLGTIISKAVQPNAEGTRLAP